MKRTSLIILLIFGIIGLAIFNGCGAKESKESKESRRAVSITGPVGSDGNKIFVSKSMLAKKYSDIDIEVQPVGGAAEAMALVGQGEGNFAPMDGVAFYQVLNLNNSKALYISPEEFNNLRILYAFKFGGVKFTTRADWGIKTIKDLKGKKVNVGTAGSIAARTAQVILSAHGVNEGDYTPSSLGIAEAVDALKDGRIDAMMGLHSGPVPQIMELDASHPVYIIPLEEEAIKKLSEISPAWGADYFPTDLYKNQTNETPPLSAFGTYFMGANVDTDPKLVKDLLELFFENIEEYHANAGGGGKFISFEDALKVPAPIKMPLHQGAYDYYKEKGVEIPDYFLPADGDFYAPASKTN